MVGRLLKQTVWNPIHSRLSDGCAVLAITTGKKKIQSSWEIFITTGKKRYITTGKKRYSRHWQEISIFFVVAGNFDYDRKKKDTVVKKKIQSSVCWVAVLAITTGKKRYSRLSVGCAVLAITTGKKRYSRKKDTLRPEKKDTVVCLMGARFWQLRPEKKDTVVLGNFHYNRKKKIHYDRKKRYIRLWREISIFFVVAGNFDYDRKKKVQS